MHNADHAWSVSQMDSADHEVLCTCKVRLYANAQYGSWRAVQIMRCCANAVHREMSVA